MGQLGGPNGRRDELFLEGRSGHTSLQLKSSMCICIYGVFLNGLHLKFQIIHQKKSPLPESRRCYDLELIVSIDHYLYIHDSDVTSHTHKRALAAAHLVASSAPFYI